MSAVLGLKAFVEFEAGQHLAFIADAIAASAPAVGILFMGSDATVRRLWKLNSDG